MYSESEVTTGIAEIGYIPKGFSRFSRPAVLRLRRSSLGYIFLAAPCGYGKIVENAGWKYF
ncbi:MAG: hypothetical protein Q7S52_02545 [bacterium]|nr:hypothetical protein [bacterium]